MSAAVLREACKAQISGASRRPSGGANPRVDSRGGHNKTSAEILNEIRLHINSFPRVDSHYCRATRICEFLEGTLSISHMYRLYREKMMLENKGIAKEHLYSDVLVNEFNLRFHMPSKDACDTCKNFEQRRQQSTLCKSDQNEFDLHIKRKAQARDWKMLDKACASDKRVCGTQ